MAVTIQQAQATITPEFKEAKPDHAFNANNSILFGHLTHGWNGSDWIDDAVTATGSVPIIGPQAETDLVELGFVQIAKAVTFQAFYAGRVPSEGSVALNYFVPPAMTSPVFLDRTKTAREPWYRNPVFGVGAGNRRPANFGDHPGMVVFTQRENRSCSNVKNFLFHAFLEREFWTILTALERGKKPVYLSHFKWQLRYEFQVRWKNKEPTVVKNDSTIKPLRGATLGRPTEQEIQALLDDPRGERANDIGTRAEIITTTGNPPNRTDQKTIFTTVPFDFWT
jgi:hypothetical protein